jgi:glycosyltransferase involved in cell wall biosynthesis
MKLSFAIPFYNKSAYIEATLRSIADVCAKSTINWEVLITDNCSQPEESSELKAVIARTGLVSRASVFTLSATVSAHENWLYALSLCSGDLINLKLADDPLLDFDIDHLVSCFSDPTVDYVSTNSRPDFDQSHEMNVDDVLDYYEKVKRFKKAYAENPVECYCHLFNGDNPFGDINSLFMRRKCIDLLREPVQLFNPAFLSFPDLEIWLKVTSGFKGLYLDIDTSRFTYNKSSPASRAKNDFLYRSMVYYLPSEVSRLLIYHPAYKGMFYDKLTEQQKLLKTYSVFELLGSKSGVSLEKLFLVHILKIWSSRLHRLRMRASRFLAKLTLLP